MEYHEIFHKYRSDLNSNGITDTFHERLSRDLNKILTIRMKIAADINNLLRVSSAKIDAFDQMVNDLIQSILVYLNMHDIARWEGLGVIGRKNPTFERISIMVGYSPNDVDTLFKFLDSVIENLQKEYNDVTDKFSSMKSFLLTGNN